MIRRAPLGVFDFVALLVAPTEPSHDQDPSQADKTPASGTAPATAAAARGVLVRRLRWLIAALSAVWLACLLPLGAAARQPRLQASSDKQYKVKSKGGVERIRDKSKPVRAALEAQYAKMVEAYRNDDPTVVLELRTPDFSVQMPSGERWDAEQSAAYVRAGFDQVEKTLDLSFTIEEIDVQGDTAAAMIHQRWSRLQMKQGQLRRVETSACQRETWIDTPEGWRLHLIDSVRPLVWVIDGKRVDPSKPYDPDAPPYAPDVEPTSPCTD